MQEVGVPYIRRTLWFDTAEGRHSVGERELLHRSEPLVVLGEPGMGKSELLKSLAFEATAQRVTARQLINSPDPRSHLVPGSPLIIDALDEVPARGAGDAVDLVLQRLGQCGFPRFVLSCRVADWRSATSVAAIQEQYELAPLEVHLEPLTKDEQLTILTEKVGVERAKGLLSHFETFGLEFLGNPQTIELISRLPDGEEPPNSSGALIDFAIEALRKEHREGRPELPGADARSAAGAAFAGLILTGKARITRRASANIEEDQVSLVDLQQLCAEPLDGAVRTRLFTATSGDDLTYWHRRIGEFLGAKWLAARSNTRGKRKRILELFLSRGVVPASLRGMHAWLASDPTLALEVIATDPMGVVEYGDADVLSPNEATALFDALERLAARNPWFKGWHEVRARALVGTTLRDRAEIILRDKSAPFNLRALLADQFVDRTSAAPFRATLRDLLRDGNQEYYIRRKAAEGLSHFPDEDWKSHHCFLLEQGTHDSTRLAFDLLVIDQIGLGAFSDDEVVRAILAHDGLLVASIKREPPSDLILSFWRFESCVPESRLDSLLDTLTDYASELLPNNAGIDENQFIDLAYALILRRLHLGPVDALKLWRWLTPYEEQYFYKRDNEQILARWFVEHHDTRREIQKHVILDKGREDVRRSVVRLWRHSAGLGLSDEDVAVLLSHLDPEARQDFVWRELLEQVQHDDERGRIAREAAKPFVAHNAQLAEWLDRLAVPKIPAWKIKQDRQQQQRERKQAARFEEHRRQYLQDIQKVREGQFGFVHAPAQAYLKMFRDIGNELEPERRIAQWLGDDVAAAAHEGFERFLLQKPDRVTAMRIAVGFAKGTRWLATDVLVAALAERLRTKQHPFADLTEERLLAGLFTVWGTRIHDHAGFPELEKRLEEEVKLRGAWERAVRIYIGPQLRRRKEHVGELYALMRSEDSAEMATRLASDWLRRCPDLPPQPEAEMIDRLIHSRELGVLRDLLFTRTAQDLDPERRRNWDAVRFLVDPDSFAESDGLAIEKELLWHIRARCGGRRSDERISAVLATSQRAWVVAAFRHIWPNRERPSGTSSGDQNFWDAADYIKGQISILGEDTSPEAMEAIASLLGAEEDSYSDYLRVVSTEQQQKFAEQMYSSPSLEELKTILDAGPAIDSADLKAIVLDAFETAQGWLKGSPIDWYEGFFREDGRHKDEEPCRHELIKMLLAIEPHLEYIPESHVADDKRVDIVVQAGPKLIVPIEVKGQWHSNLWTAADEQLDHLYRNDWRADHGIYLVLWFGHGAPLAGPPVGVDRPETPEELSKALVRTSRAAQAGTVSIVVLDLTRPTRC